MKKIEQIREQYDLITEKEEAESRKLTTLVRAGLFDPKKLPMLKRALSKDPKDMTPAERKILIELLDSLMAEVLSSQQVYSKVKQNVMMKEEDELIDEAVSAGPSKTQPSDKFNGYLSKYDPRYAKMPSEREIPTVIILKRKAIRVYPDNQKVALYYSQALDKYVTIPFGTFDGNINEAITSDEDDNYIAKSTFTKYKNKDDQKNILRMHGELQKMKSKMSSGQYKDAKSKKTASDVIKSRQEALTKAMQNAPKETVTKKTDLSKKNASTLSKGNFDRLMQGISKDKDMNLATKIGAKIGLKVARAWDNKGKPSASKPKTPVQESATKSKFYAKRNLQKPKNDAVEEGVFDAIDTGVRSAANVLGGDYIAAAGNYAVKKLMGKDTTYSDELAKEKGITAQKEKDNPTAAKVGTVAGYGLGAAGVARAAGTKVGQAALQGTGKLVRGAGKLAAGAALGSLAGGGSDSGGGGSEQKFSTPKDFTLQAKTSKSKGNVRTAVDAKDAATYRKSMQQNESVLNQLYNIHENEEKSIQIGNESVLINNSMAKKVIGVYESVNKNNKQKIEGMLNESVDSFKKILSFAARQ